MYGEMFDTRVRLSGMAIGTQLGFALGGFAPSISAAILGDGPTGWMPVAAFTTAAAVVSALSAFTARETYRVPMAQLGKLGAQEASTAAPATSAAASAPAPRGAQTA